MSRNLGHTKCYFCGYPQMNLTEKSRQKPRELLGAHYEEYKYVEFARAECPACRAEYLAWCGGIHQYMGLSLDGGRYRTRQFQAINTGGEGYSDLSFRSTFNDEPGEADMPKRKVRLAWVDESGAIIAELPKEAPDAEPDD